MDRRKIAIRLKSFELNGTSSMLKKIRIKLLLPLAGLILLGFWMQYTPPGLMGKAKAVGYAVCHQIPSHSFQIQGKPLALCARCSGQYLGVLLGLLYLGVLGKRRSGRPSWLIFVFMGVAFASYAVDGVNSFLSVYPDLDSFTLYTPRNAYRLLSGLGMGLTVSIGVYLLFSRAVWRQPSRDPVFSSPWPWLGLIGLGGVISLGVLSGVPAILYPLTLLSVMGLLVLLTVLYALLWIIAFGKENAYRRGKELVWVMLGGGITAMMQIALLDLLRFWSTGTWSGFHIG